MYLIYFLYDLSHAHSAAEVSTEKMFWTFTVFVFFAFAPEDVLQPNSSRQSSQFSSHYFFDQQFPHTLVLQSLVIQSHDLKLLQATATD